MADGNESSKKLVFDEKDFFSRWNMKMYQKLYIL